MAETFGLSFAAVSQHLKSLKEADLVTERREGRQRIYHLHPKPLQTVVSWVDEFEAYDSTLSPGIWIESTGE